MKNKDEIVKKDMVARPTLSKVLVNGEEKSFDAYLIEGNIFTIY